MKDAESEINQTPDVESSHQVRLGELLQKKRDPQATHKIEEILQQSLSIDEKIRQIEALDKAEQSQEYLSRRDLAPHRTASPGQAEFDESTVQTPYFDDIRRARKKIKRIIRKTGLWDYLLHEHTKIRQFGRQSHIFGGGFLFSGFRFNPNLQDFLISRVQKPCAIHLLPGLRLILQHGWQFLTKQSYNSLNLLYLLTEELISTNFAHIDFRKRDVIEKIKKLEYLYLSFRAIPDHADIVYAAIKDAYTHMPHLHEKAPKIEHHLALILQQEYSLPSFPNFILGANMVYARRYLTFSDLIIPDHAAVISGSDWECAPELYKDIRRRIWELEQEIEPLTRYYDEVCRKTNYLPTNQQGGPDLSVLAGLWDAALGKGDYSRSVDNISRFSKRACELLLGPVQELLIKPIRSREKKNFKLFTEQAFLAEFSRIENARDALEKLLEIMPTFSRERFIQLKQSRRGSIPNEAAIIQKISIIISSSRSILNRLIEVLRVRMRTEEESSSFPPIDALMIRKGGFFLPFEASVLATPRPFAGKTVAKALHLTISLLLLLEILFLDHETTSLMKRETKLREKIIETGREIHRLANPPMFQQLREEYRLELFGL